MSDTTREFEFAPDRIPKVHFREYLRTINDEDEPYDQDEFKSDVGLISNPFSEREKLNRYARRLRRRSG
jgi:hypothetical protein